MRRAGHTALRAARYGILLESLIVLLGAFAFFVLMNALAGLVAGLVGLGVVLLIGGRWVVSDAILRYLWERRIAKDHEALESRLSDSTAARPTKPRPKD